MLNTIHLQTFLAVVEAGNYSAAAERLHMSQPAVSQHIRALESQLDSVRLFRRVGQQMLLTHAGEDLVESAREMLALSARAVAITIAPTETLLEWMENHQAQVLLIEEQQRRRGWESQLLRAERLVLIAPRGHALLQQEQAPPGLLRDQPLVLPRAGTPLRRIIEDGLRRRGIGAADIHVAIETDGAALAIQAVRAGLGLAFIPQTRLPRGRDIGMVDLAGVNLQQDWYILRSRERGAPRAVHELYSFIAGKDAQRVLAKDGLKIASE